MKTPYDMLAKIYAKYFGHMAKVAATPINGKTPFKNLLLQNQKAQDLGTWYVALGMWAYQICSNDDPKLTLTYLTSRSNFLPKTLKWEIFVKVDFFNAVEASHYSHLIC